MNNFQLLVVSIFIGSSLTVVFYFTFAEKSVSIVKGLLPLKKGKNLTSQANIRLLCFIPTAMRTLYTKALAVKDTWSKKCDRRVFFSSEKDATFPTVQLNVREGLEGLTSKTMLGLQFIYKHYFNETDWFLKADDDTYVIIENLKHLLAKYDFNEPLYLGHHYNKFAHQGYMSGGAGYVLSKEAVRRVGTVGLKNSTICRTWGGAEDVALGKCLENLGVTVASSLDSEGRQTFHPFNIASHLFGPLPNWYYNYSKHPIRLGKDCCSDLSISFHSVEPMMMRVLDYILYHLDVKNAAQH